MREHRGWSQAELGGNAGYSKSLIATMETHQRAPTRALVLALDKAFGAPRTFERLETRLRNVPFPASFRPFATYDRRS